MKKLTLLFAALLAVSMSFATTVTKTVNQLVEENEWTVSANNVIGTLATNFALDNVITVSTTGAPNCGSIWGTTTNDWRLYQNKNGNVTIDVAEGYELQSVKFTFNISNSGLLLDAAGSTVSSNSVVEVNGQNVTFTVGNSNSTATNGQVRITAFEVTYLAVGDSTIIPVDTTSQDTTPVIVPVTMENLTFNAGVWNQDNAKFGAWVWGENLDAQFTDFFVPGNDSNLYLAQVPETADSIVFVRFADTVTVPAWGNGIVWNQTMNYAVNHADMYFTITDWTTGTWGTPVVVMDLTDAMATAVGTNVTTTGIVTYINGKNAYMQNAATGVLLYNSSAFSGFAVGDEIVIDGTTAMYKNQPELSGVTLRSITSQGNTVNPIVMTLAERAADHLKNFGMMITINELTITAYDNDGNPTFSDGTNTIAGYNFPVSATDFPVNSVVDVTAIAGLFNTTLQFTGDPAGVVLHEYPAPLVMDTIIFVPSMWNAADAKVAAWVWGDSLEGMWTEMIALDSTLDEIYEIAVPVLAQNIKFVRFASNVTAPAWEGAEIWNQTGDKVMDFETGIFTITDWNDGIWGTPVPEPVKYYIKNNWNGGDWAWVEMNTVIDSVLYDYTGVFGGSGVDINTTAADEGSTWFSVADFRTIDSTYVPQALDTIHFVYSIVDSVIAVELVGRPAPAPLTYYIKNNWNGGDWAWVEMNTVIDSVLYDYTGVWGGTGVDIRHNRMPDTVSIWIPAENFRTLDSTFVPQALDTLHFVYSIVDSVLAVELVGRPAPAPLTYYIKNNWNGGDWAWVEMNTVIDNALYEYTGVWGGTGVDIRHNRMPDTASIWFPVADFRTIDSTYVPQALDTIHFVYSIVDSVIAVELVGRPALVYYIKNNWDGAAATDWTWREMTPVVDNALYEYTGVWGGTGVDIRHNRMPDTASIWIPAENFRTLDSTFVPQALDTLHFVYSLVDSALAVELVGRPALVYYIKNNWDGAAATDWTWREMTPVVDNALYEYTGVWGGTGVDIRHNRMPDTASIWFPVEKFSVLDSTFVPQALDTLHFVYSLLDSALAVELVGRPAPAPEVFQIKNNWNGGEWTWVEMTPVVGEENVYQYTGIFGGKGVNITSNYMNGELWFPVDSFLLNEGDLVPQYKDTVLFAYNSVENEVAAMVLGRHIFNTCAEVNAITANTNMELGEVTVVFAKGSYIYVEDATATTLVYTNKYGNLKAGDRVWGIAGEAKLFKGLPELAANTDFDKLVVTEGAARAIEDATAAPTMEDINKVMMFRNVAMPTAAFDEGTASNIEGIFNGDTVIFRNNWKEAYTFDSTKTYTMLGCVAVFNGLIQVYVTDIQEYAPVQYYIKNNWNRATDWTWEEMIPANDGGETWMYTGIFGGTGVDINTAMNDEGKKWFAIADMIIPEGNVAPEAGDSVMFVYNTIDETMTATVLSQVIPGEDITVTVWVRNENTNWEHLYVYGWGGAEEIFGAWPGLQLDVDYVLEPDKFDYTNMFHITGDYEGLEENLIFNSGAGQQFPDLKILLTEDAEYYIVITNDGAHFEGEEGLETVIANSENETVKVILNGQLYIVRDGKVYNALGAQVR